MDQFQTSHLALDVFIPTEVRKSQLDAMYRLDCSTLGFCNEPHLGAPPFHLSPGGLVAEQRQ